MLRLEPVRWFATGTVSGLGLRYPAPRGAHALVGRRIPDIALVQDPADGPCRLYEALRQRRFVLVGAEVPEGWRDRVLGVRAVVAGLPVALVRPDGSFSFPLVGEVDAKGKTVADLTKTLSQRLTKFISDPVVTVSIQEIKGNKVYVIGQVNRPGEFIMNPSVDVMQALRSE